MACRSRVYDRTIDTARFAVAYFVGRSVTGREEFLRLLPVESRSQSAASGVSPRFQTSVTDAPVGGVWLTSFILVVVSIVTRGTDRQDKTISPVT